MVEGFGPHYIQMRAIPIGVAGEKLHWKNRTCSTLISIMGNDHDVSRQRGLRILSLKDKLRLD